MELAPNHIQEEMLKAPSAADYEMQANIDVAFHDRNHHDSTIPESEQHICGPECLIHSRQEAIDEANAALDAILLSEVAQSDLTQKKDEVKIFEDVSHTSYEIDGHTCGPNCMIHSRKEAVAEANAALDAILFGDSETTATGASASDQDAANTRIEDNLARPTTLPEYEGVALQKEVLQRAQDAEYDLRQASQELPVSTDINVSAEVVSIIQGSEKEVIIAKRAQGVSDADKYEASAKHEVDEGMTQEEVVPINDIAPPSPDMQISVDGTEESTKSLPVVDLPNVRDEYEATSLLNTEQETIARANEKAQGSEFTLDYDAAYAFTGKAPAEEHLDETKNKAQNFEIHNEFMTYIDASLNSELVDDSLSDKDDTVEIIHKDVLKRRTYLSEIEEVLITIENEISSGLANDKDEWLQKSKELLGSDEVPTTEELQVLVMSGLLKLDYEPKLSMQMKKEIAKLPPAEQEIVLLRMLLKILEIKQDAGDRKTASNANGTYQDMGATNLEKLAVVISRLLFFGYGSKAVLKFS